MRVPAPVPSPSPATGSPVLSYVVNLIVEAYVWASSESVIVSVRTPCPAGHQSLLLGAPSAGPGALVVRTRTSSQSVGGRSASRRRRLAEGSSQPRRSRLGHRAAAVVRIQELRPFISASGPLRKTTFERHAPTSVPRSAETLVCAGWPLPHPVMTRTAESTRNVNRASTATCRFRMDGEDIGRRRDTSVGPSRGDGNGCGARGGPAAHQWSSRRRPPPQQAPD